MTTAYTLRRQPDRGATLNPPSPAIAPGASFLEVLMINTSDFGIDLPVPIHDQLED